MDHQIVNVNIANRLLLGSLEVSKHGGTEGTLGLPADITEGEVADADNFVEVQVQDVKFQPVLAVLVILNEQVEIRIELENSIGGPCERNYLVSAARSEG